jgi:single-strand DNA-binding protein
MNLNNSVSMIGRLGADPEVVSASGKTSIVRFQLANNERRYDEKDRKWTTTHTNWVRITCFNWLASRALTGLKKGDLVHVMGTLRTSEYEKDGAKKYGFEIIASQLLETKSVRGSAEQTEDDGPMFGAEGDTDGVSL